MSDDYIYKIDIGIGEIVKLISKKVRFDFEIVKWRVDGGILRTTIKDITKKGDWDG